MKRVLSLGLAALLAVSSLSAALGEEDPGLDFHPAETVEESSENGYESDTGDVLEYLGDPDEPFSQDLIVSSDPGDDEEESDSEESGYSFETDEYYFDPPVYMFVYTDNYGDLNVRNNPDTRGTTVIGRLPYGTRVKIVAQPRSAPDWYMIEFLGGRGDAGYVMQRYLVDNPPAPKPQKRSSESGQKESSSGQQSQAAQGLQDLNRQLATAGSFASPLSAVVRASRTTGRVNFRVGPSMSSDLIFPLPDGHPLTVLGATDDWYQVMDAQSGRVGYIHKNYVSVQAVSLISVSSGAPKEQLGRLSVNGEFSLQCRLPEGYQLQVISTQSSRITASITSTDLSKPVLYLTIAYSELYSGARRLNDFGPDDLLVLESTFTNMNQVEISYRQTAYGTKLLVARETGADADFVDIFTVYMGYAIEFVMTPNPGSADKTLTEKQVQMCVDFLSDLDFVQVR